MVRFHWAAASPRRDVSPFRAHRTRSLSTLLLSTRRSPQALDADRIRLPPRHLPNHHGHAPSDRMHHGHANVWPFRALQSAPAGAGHRRWPHAARDLEVGFLHPLRGNAQKVAVPSARRSPSACGPSPDRARCRPGMEKVSQGLRGLPATRKRASRRPRLGPVFGQVRRLPSDLGTTHRAVRRSRRSLLVRRPPNPGHPARDLAGLAIHRPHGPALAAQGISTGPLLWLAQPHPLRGRPPSPGAIPSPPRTA
jgi:hypothetical protein